MLGFTNFTSIRPDDQIQVSTESVIPQHGMQPDQIVLSLLQFCPGHWHPDATELMDGCLPDALSCYKVGEEKKRRGKKKGKNLRPGWSTSIPEKHSHQRTENPDDPTALETLSPPDWLLQTALDQPVGFKESHSAGPCKSHLPFLPSPCPNIV